MREPKDANSSLNFQFSGVIVVSPGKNLPPFGTKTTKMIVQVLCTLIWKQEAKFLLVYK
jgi:hypothetical protein